MQNWGRNRKLRGEGLSHGCISYFANHKKKNTPTKPPTTKAKKLPSNLWLFSKLSPGSPRMRHVRLSHEKFSMSRKFFFQSPLGLHIVNNYGVLVDEDCRSVFVSLTCFQLCNRLVPLTCFDTVKFILHRDWSLKFYLDLKRALSSHEVPMIRSKLYKHNFKPSLPKTLYRFEI